MHTCAGIWMPSKTFLEDKGSRSVKITALPHLVQKNNYSGLPYLVTALYTESGVTTLRANIHIDGLIDFEVI